MGSGDIGGVIFVMQLSKSVKSRQKSSKVVKSRQDPSVILIFLRASLLTKRLQLLYVLLTDMIENPKGIYCLSLGVGT